MRYLNVLLGLLLLLVTLPAGAGDPTRSHEGPVDYASFVDALRAAGATVVPVKVPPPPPPTHESPSSFFGTEDREHIITVNERQVQTFEFSTRELTEAAAGGIAPDGYTISTISSDGRIIAPIIHVDWIDYPHFYKSGRLIVLYVGKDGEILHLLTTVLGPQIAGR